MKSGSSILSVINSKEFSNILNFSVTSTKIFQPNPILIEIIKKIILSNDTIKLQYYLYLRLWLKLYLNKSELDRSVKAK